MIFSIQVMPKQLAKDVKLYGLEAENQFLSEVYIGQGTYCIQMIIDNGASEEEQKLCYNLQIGRYNSIAENLNLVFYRNHNICNVSTMPFYKFYPEKLSECDAVFNQKGSIIIQNDVWIGQNVTIMPGVVIRNGAVIARNSHVVSDVPPYAIVGGNPAKIIGYRHTSKQREMLQVIQWWNWEEDELYENMEYFTEDIDGFCSRFYPAAKLKYQEYIGKQSIAEEEVYFLFVDFYEVYMSYTYVLEEFLNKYSDNNSKKLVMFVRDDLENISIDDGLLQDMKGIARSIALAESIKCRVELVVGGKEDAKRIFLHTSHYIVNRTYDTVYFSCLADQLKIPMISGVDTIIQFEKKRNMHSKES